MKISVEFTKLAMASAALFFATTTNGYADVITSGNSILTINEQMEEVGLTFAPRDETTETEDNVFSLIVTGGEMEDGVGNIDHEGSVITIDDAFGATNILWNLSVDTTDGNLGVVTGNIINRNGWFYDLSLFVFEISDFEDNLVDLYFTSAISAALTEFYLLDPETFAGIQFGTLGVSFAFGDQDNVLENPVPAALPIFLTGIAGLNFLRQRRRKKQAA